jgi:ABC-type arginine transport system ATPase subunit
MGGLELFDILKGLAGIVLPIITALTVYVMREIRRVETRTGEVDQRLVDHRVEVARDYASREAIERLESKIFSSLDRIEQKIDRRA